MRKFIFRTLGLIWPALAASPALAQSYADRSDFWHYGWGWGHMIFGSVLMILFWAGIILLVVLAVRWLGGKSAEKPGGSRKTAIEILEERFARGEIEKAEYEEKKRILSE